MEWLLVVFADVVFSGFLSAFFSFSPDDGERSRPAGGSLVMRPLTQGRRGSKPQRERGDYSIFDDARANRTKTIRLLPLY